MKMKNGLYTSFDGTQMWYRHNLFHREDGPAIIYFDGRMNWFLNGVEFTEAEFKKYLNQKTIQQNLESLL